MFAAKVEKLISMGGKEVPHELYIDRSELLQRAKSEKAVAWLYSKIARVFPSLLLNL